jgi:ankyrin repeat protein
LTITGGASVLLELQNKALRNAIVQQLAKQQDYTVLSDDYSELAKAVNSKDMDHIKKALQETQDINEHYKNWSAAHQAAQDGSLEILRLLVENGADIKVRTETKTLLLSAVSENKNDPTGNHLNIAKYLIAQGADVNARIVTNLLSPLIYAAKNNQTEMVSLLLENGAELWAEDYAGSSAWEWATHNNHKEVIKLFEAFNAKQGFAAFDAIKVGDLRQFKREVNRMTNIYQLSPNNNSSSLLSKAAQAGELEMVQFLINKGFDINFDAVQGVTGAYLAAKSNQLKLLTFLAEQGADLQKQSYFAPIHTAAYRGHMDIMKFLLNQKYVDPLLASNSDKSTALHSAIEGNHTDIVELLLQHPAYYNANVMKTDAMGNTPLIFLFKNKHDNPRIFEMLMKQPWTKISDKNNEGKTAYDYAEEADLHIYLHQL